MKLEIGLRKAALLGIVCLSVVFCNTGSIKEANASTANPESSLAAANNTLSEKNSNLYPMHAITNGNDLYGFVDQTGSIVIKPSYTWAGNFSDGLAVVYQDGTYLAINTKGKVILKTSNYVNDFHNGLASFTDTKTYKNGYINNKGKIVIKASYNFASDFGKDHTAIVSKSGKFYRINSEGKILKTYPLNIKNYYGVTGDGYITYTDSKTFLEGVKDLNGKTILKASYSDATYLGNGLFGVKKKLPDGEGYLTGVMPSALFDKNGKQLTSYKYYDLSVYTNQYASCTDSKYTYLIDTKGNKVSSFPKQEGRGTLTVLGNVVQANIDNTLYYLKMDGTLIWKGAEATALSSGITVHSVKVKPNKYVAIYYPKLEGLSDLSTQKKINDKLEGLFTADRMKLTEKDALMVDDNFSVDQLKDLLVICRTGYDFPFGAAHGTPIRLYYFIDTKTGTFYQFKDLFKKDSNYVKALDNIVRKKMKAQETADGSFYFTSDSTYVTESQFFDLSNDTLTVYFDSGAIAPYAAGFPQFEIPFSDITNLIDKDGAFWKSFHQ
ncbi:WG repeat-containing protein [Anaerocolumna xylanovorans]|uniref:WG containing repeat-containing protein n=1 Tax=Anaerocolumna xylanovorans DSM 12503 TaxID=1121345 RepID=A0A1M7Y959_9FIRM|nr:WG repeat-containing protein [Anaerocolumna xylanovorans]SHO49172.1 WG containing repeat-containing protein [Anaerocolumna xylanovorans DSM 12503]